MSFAAAALNPLIPALPEGPLSSSTRVALREIDPAGIILFARNEGSVAEVRALTDAVRDALGREVLILVDHEGGRVQRFRSSGWWHGPAPERIAAVAAADLPAGERAAYLTALLLARPLAEAGVRMNCVPCVDLRHVETAPFLADRTFGDRIEQVTGLGRLVCAGSRAGGVLPILKHMPGHGRATADSHIETPLVDTDLATLDGTDFVPFRALKEEPFGMVAHVTYSAVDPDRPISQSAEGVRSVIRGLIGFEGLLMSDCITMEALDGTPAERAQACQRAGMDLIIYNEPDMDQVRRVAGTLAPMAAERVRGSTRP